MDPAGPARRLKALLRPILGAAALIFVAFAAVDLWSRWNESSVPVHAGWTFVAFIPAALAMVLQWAAWMSLMNFVTKRRLPWRPAAVLYLDSQMARYMPGKVGLPAVRVAGAPRLNVEPRLMGVGLLVELASWCAVGMLVGLSVLSVVSHRTDLVASQVSILSWGLTFSSLAGVVVLCSVPRRSLPRFLTRLLSFSAAARDTVGAGPASPNAEERPLIPWRLPILHVLHWSSWVLAGAMLARAVGGQALECWVAGAVLCLAIVLGFLALLAPAGAGVREAVIGVAIAPLLGAAAAVALGLLARAASLSTDLILWGAARLFLRSAEAPSSSEQT